MGIVKLKYENSYVPYILTGWPYCEAFDEAEWTDDSQ